MFCGSCIYNWLESKRGKENVQIVKMKLQKMILFQFMLMMKIKIIQIDLKIYQKDQKQKEIQILIDKIIKEIFHIFHLILEDFFLL